MRFLTLLLALTTLATAPAVAHAEELGLVGFGLRVTRTTKLQFHDATEAPYIGDKAKEVISEANTALQHWGVPHQYGLNEFDADFDGIWEVTPTIHLGGEGYFMRFEFPFGFGEGYRSYGFGMYPVGYALRLGDLPLMPYALVGGTAHYAETQSKFRGPDFTVPVMPPYALGLEETVSQMGVVVEAKAIIGAKLLLLPRLPISLELSYSPYMIGAFWSEDRYDSFVNGTDAERLEMGVSKSPASAVRGGRGDKFAVSVGVEWF